MPLWEKIKSMFISVVEAQAYTTGIFAPEDLEDEDVDPAAPVDMDEKK